AGELRARVDAEAVHQRTGAVIHSSYLPAKLLWLRQSRPDLVKSVAYWMSFGEYLYLRLFGERRVSVSMASGTGLFDQRACTWDAEMLDVVGIKESSLSPVAEFSEAMNGPRGIVGSAWEHVREIPWYLAVGDGAANNLGSGGDRPETWVLMVGTSGALRVVRNVEPGTIPPGLWSYRVDRRRIIQGGALSSGGNVFAWLSQSLQLPGPEQVEAELAAMEPDAHGLTILPFLAGERSPGWKADAHGAFAGVSLATRPLEIVRASLESIAYRFALVYDLLQSDVGAPRSIIGSGAGLLDSPTWMQIMADVLGGPLVASAALEASARGAALLALEAAGAIQDSTEVAAPLGIEYAPVAGHARIYRAAMERQNVLYRKVVQ
ncbi:MAG TPA: FGGY-family carbohydrate kinase, partial [Chloroflexota bacterium]